MTNFLWVVIVLMGVSLLAEVAALIGLAVTVRRAAKRGREIATQLSERIQASTRVAQETRAAIEPRVQALTRDSKDIGVLVKSRLDTLKAVYADASRRADRARLRLNGTIQTVEGQGAAFREAVEPMQIVGQLLSGVKAALWVLRKVA